MIALLALSVCLVVASPVAGHHSFGALYTGTHSAGGTMEFDVSPDGSVITRFRFMDVPCQDGLSTLNVEVTGGVPIANHAFDTEVLSVAFAGSFPQNQSATGTYQSRNTSPSSCVTDTVSWNATTTAALPPPCADSLDNDGDGRVDFAADPGCSNGADTDETDPPQCSDRIDNDGDGRIDLGFDTGCSSSVDNDESDPPDITAPTVWLSGKKTQTAGRSVSVGVSCPDEACTAKATGSANVAGSGSARRFGLRAVISEIRRGGRATLRLRVPRQALVAIRRALGSGTKVAVKLSVTVRDAAGNRTVRRRTIRLIR